MVSLTKLTYQIYHLFVVSCSAKISSVEEVFYPGPSCRKNLLNVFVLLTMLHVLSLKIIFLLQKFKLRVQNVILDVGQIRIKIRKLFDDCLHKQSVFFTVCFHVMT